MPRAIWSGSISFGLLSLPVKAQSATSRQRIDFDLLHDADGGRIEYRRVCRADGNEVPWEHIVKGYEIEPGRYVTFTQEEMDALQPDMTRTIDIEDFVQLSQIDPMYFDAAYFLLPEPAAARAYRLLHAVMADAGVVALARVVLRTRQRLVAIRPLAGGVLSMETMHFAAEVRPPPELPAPETQKSTQMSKREVAMARQLVDALTTDFDPEHYVDTYRLQLVQRIEQKAAGEVVEAPTVSTPAATPASDIMAALEASLQAARTSRPAPPRRRRRTASKA